MRFPVHAVPPTVVVFLLVVAGAVAADGKAENSPFAGEYRGPFTFKASDSRFTDQSGTVSLSINAAGKVRGKIENATADQKADVTGAVDNDGGLEYIVEFPRQAYVLRGTVTRTRKGHLKGTLTQYLGKDQTVGSVDFDLPPR